ncbi:MAG: sulfite exporter TauE/SafE family protein [Candidatus Latescibacterota bacterium]|nr:sulfite exporter TauE/SafE family protein [Candidatus Latescibacterota bacterium]
MLIDNETIVLVNIICFFAAAVSALTGFGYSLLATPCVSLIMAPRLAVPLVLFSSLVLLILLTLDAWRKMDFVRIGRWLIGAVPAIWIGGYALSVFADVYMRSFIGCATLVGALAIWCRPGVPFKNERPWAILSGVFSGVMVGASSMSGPPVVLFGIKQQWDHKTFRASLVGYFSVVHLLALLVLGELGVTGFGHVLQGLWMLPGLLLGFFVGMRFRERIDNQFFRKIALVLLCVTGILALFIKVA